MGRGGWWWEVVVVVDDGVVVLVGVVVVLGVVLQLSDTDFTGPVMGRWIADRGVFGGTLTVKWRVWPLSMTTVTTQVSAAALGITATADTPKNDPTVAAATTSFRLLNTVA